MLELFGVYCMNASSGGIVATVGIGVNVVVLVVAVAIVTLTR